MRTKLYVMRMLVGMATVLGSAVTVTTAQQLRLGIAAEAPDLVVAADLVTAELTRDGSVALVERADINRVLKEQALSAGQSTNYVKMGQLLGADGLLLLQLLTEDTNRIAVARLIAVKPGVVVGAARSAFPITNALDWGSAMVARFKPLLPKLAVLPKDAVPISLLNIRAASTGPDTRELERQLTALLILRLIGERDLFVLERQRMESLTWEKSLRGVDETAFWTGSYLLDGSIDRDGTQPGQVAVHLRLAPPKDGQPVVILAEGKRDRPGDVIEKLTPRILEALNKRTIAPAWNADQEAAKYLEEAKWAHRWGMYREAQLACEAAWALGLHTRETAGLHVHVYALGIHSDRGSQTFLGPRLTFPNPPNRSALASAERALEHYLVHTHNLETNTLDEAWGGLGADVLSRTAQVLEHFCRRPNDWHGVEDKLADVRRLARDVVEAMRASPTLKDQAERALVSHGTFFQETPADEIKLYRSLIFSGVYRRQVAERPAVFWRPPEPGGWGPDDWNEGRKLWQAFLQELGANDQPAAGLEALLWRVARADNDYELEESLGAFLDAAWKHRTLILSGQISPSLWTAYEYLALNGRFDREAGSPVRLRLREQIVKPFNQRFAAAKAEFTKTSADWEEAREEDKRLAVVAALRKEVNGQPTMSSMEFFRRFGLVRPTEAEAKELLPLLVEYQKRLGKSEKSGTSLVGPVILRFRSVGNREPAVIARSAPAERLSAVPAPQPAPPPPAAPPFPELTVNRFWKLPLASTAESRRTFESICGMAFRDGRLWIQVSFEVVPRYLPLTELRSRWWGTDIHVLDPHSLTAEVIEAPRARTPGAGRRILDDWSADLAHFVVHEDWLFVRTDDGLQKYDLKHKRWSDRPLNLPADGMLASLGAELFCISSDSILRLDARTDEVTVLASCRRRPAATELDRLERFESPVLFRDDRKRLCALVGDNLYALGSSNQEWLRLSQGLGLSRRHPLLPLTGQLVLRLGDRSTRDLAVWRGDAPPGAVPTSEVLKRFWLADPVRHFEMYREFAGLLAPRWQRFSGVPTESAAGAWDGDGLWTAFAVPAVSSNQIERNNSASVRLFLLHYRNGKGLPAALSPVFTTSPEAQPQAIPWPTLSVPFPPVCLAVSADFLALAWWNQPFVWFVSKSELQRQLEATATAHAAWKSAKSTAASGAQARASRPTFKPDPAKAKRQSQIQRKIASKLRHSNKLAPVFGPLPMFKDEIVGVRFLGVAFFLACAAAVCAIFFKRNVWTVFLLFVGLAGWIAVGFWY